MTLNGQLNALTSMRVGFSYYEAERVTLSHVYPQGGPSRGGLRVTLRGYGFRDLDHGRGLACSFGASALIPATLAEGSSDQLLCESPPLRLAARTDAGNGMQCTLPRGTVSIRVTLNGNNSASSAMTVGALNYTFLDVDGRAASPSQSGVAEHFY